MTRIKNTFSIGATDLSKTQKLCESGFIGFIVVTVPNYTNPVTTTLQITDVDGYVLWTSEAFAENATYSIPELSIPIDYNYNIVATVSGVTGSANDLIVTLYVS